MSDHDEQQSAPHRGKVLEALARAERQVFTRTAPKSANAQVQFLLTRVKGSAKALAERLGTSPRTIELYRAGALTIPQKHLRAAWGGGDGIRVTTPGQSAGTRGGGHLQRNDGGRDGLLRIHVHGRSSDDGRERQITTDISPYVKQILELQEAGATEEELLPIVAEAITELHFTGWGTRADGLHVDFAQVLRIDFRF